MDRNLLKDEKQTLYCTFYVEKEIRLYVFCKY